MLTASMPPVPVFAQALPAAVAVRSINPVVLQTFQAFPNGGPALAERIRLLILQNNDLASDVARAITTNGFLTPAQREAAAQGLDDALRRLGVGGQNPEPAAAPPDSGDSGLLGNAQWLAFIAALAAAGGLVAYEATRPKSSAVSPN